MGDALAMHRRHEDDEYIDQIVIDLVPRFKTSALSGDEWRVSSRVRFLRKGFEVWSRTFVDMQVAVSGLPWFFRIAAEEIDGEFKHLDQTQELSLCQQPGCPEPSVKHYRFKKIRDCPQSSDMKEPPFEYVTAFCARHAHRGDCGLEDADDNYEVIGGGNSQASPVEDRDVSPSATVTFDPDSHRGTEGQNG